MKARALATFALGFVIALGAGWLAWPRVMYARAEQPIQFSHKVHTGEAVGMSCEDCHVLDEHGKFSGVPRLENCAGCHTEPQGTTAEEKRFVEEYVAKNREVAWHVYARQPENAYFPHAPHVVLAKIECERCHGPHGTTDTLRTFERNRLSSYARDVEGYALVTWKPEPWRQGMKMDDCSSCHHERGVGQSCLTCHK